MVPGHMGFLCRHPPLPVHLTPGPTPHPHPHPPRPSNDYEKEFIGLTSALPSRISTLMNYESNEDKGKVEVRNIKTEIANAKQLLQDMEHTNRTIAEPTKRELVKKIGIHRETLGTLGKDLTLAEQKFDRGSLFGARGAAAPLEYDKSQNARDRATAATEKLRTGTNILEDAHRRVEETIDVGADTLGQLEENRVKMMRIRGNVGEVSGVLDTARRLLRGMSRREIQNKVAVGVFAFVMVGIISLLVWYLNKPPTK